MELLHQPQEIIAQRYRILDILGQGGVGTTYEAEDLHTGQRVALKALSLRRMADWKKMELFEREARTLSQLNHPAIPRYKDYFQVDTDRDRNFYIAQQLAPGKTLANLVESGWHPDEATVRKLATHILEILIYLHSLTPPVIHRDIKPQNILMQPEEGRVFLVDFGAVQDTYHHTVTGGSTVVGTYGYMAPEQFRGQAVPATDLYGLGTTLLFLLTRNSPADLPQRQIKIDFRSRVRVSKEFAGWLDKLLEPVIEDRFPSAEEALAVLSGKRSLANFSALKPRKPKHTPISLTHTEKQLAIEIPPVWLRSEHSRLFALITLIWNGFFLLMLWIIAASGSALTPLGWVFFSVFGGVGLWALGVFFLSAASRTRLEIDRENFRMQRGVLRIWNQKKAGNAEDIFQIKLSGIGVQMNKKTIAVCVLRSRLRKYRFGSFLTEGEKEWLVGEIRDFLTNRRDAEGAEGS